MFEGRANPFQSAWKGSGRTEAEEGLEMMGREVGRCEGEAEERVEG